MNNFSAAADFSSANGLLQKESKSTLMSQQVFEHWRGFIYDNCGIYYQDNKKYLLESRLLRRINYLNLESFEDYLAYVKGSPSKMNEMKYLFEAITINETFFFRNQPQLDALSSSIIPEILNNKKGNGQSKIRIWSAASSSGEEAYSIAITIVEKLLPKYPYLDFEIVGTDISNNVIEIAKKGLYKEYSVRNTPALYLKKYFKYDGHFFEVDPQLGKKVSFKLLNLYEEQGMKTMNNFDIIFCANVLIYFDMNAKIKVINRLYSSLNKDGYLFIGYSETLHNISKAFKLVSFPKTIGYKK